MNAGELLRHYERVADAPDAVSRLRRFVLELAVRGKLIPQFAGDQQSADLVALVRDPSSQGNSLPRGWVYATVGQLLDFKYGKGLASSDRSTSGPTPVFGSNGVVCFTTTPLTENPSIIVGRKGSAGALNICDGPSWTTDVAYYIEPPPFFELRYLYLALSALGLDALGKGVKPGLSRSDAYEIEIWVPPFAEQHRIVAKVDELMSLCDRLEAARAEREAVRDRLAAASLARLNAPDPETFADDARFALDALPALTARPDQIKQLRQAVFNLALRGRLVELRPSDGSGRAVAEQVAFERELLVKGGLIRREAPLEPVSQTEMPFDLPSGWEWVRLGNAVLFTQYGTSQKSAVTEVGVPVLAMGNIQDGAVLSYSAKRIPADSDELPALYLKKFDLLYNRTNSAELVGKTGIYLGEDDTATFASYLIRLRPSLAATNPRFLNLAMNTTDFRATQIMPLIKKQTGQANVNGSALKNMLIPLPPLAVQTRLVNKVDEIVSVCAQMERSLQTRSECQAKLLDSLLRDALEPAVALDEAA